jgi:hypothetical protein
MNTRLEIQSAIEQLPKDEIRALSKWLQKYIDDNEIETDNRSSYGLHDSFEAAAILSQALAAQKAALHER